MQWRRWGSNPRPFGLESSTLPLSHFAPFNLLVTPPPTKLWMPLALNILIFFYFSMKTCSGETFQINSFLASGNFCRLLITFASSLDPDQVLNWIQTIWHWYSVPERIFWKVMQTTTKAWKVTWHAELMNTNKRCYVYKCCFFVIFQYRSIDHKVDRQSLVMYRFYHSTPVSLLV